MDGGAGSGSSIRLTSLSTTIQLDTTIIARASSPATVRALKKLPKRGIWLLTRLDDSEQGRKGQKRASGPAGFVGYSGMMKVIKRLYREAGLGKPAANIDPWHSLRHAYGTRLANANVPLTVIGKLMGHADIRTTMRYLTTTEDQKAQAVARVFR